MEQMIEGLKKGRVLVVDRIDAPELFDLQELEARGMVESEVVLIDDQSTAIKYRWKNHG